MTMTNAELAELHKHMANAEHYLEYGAGASTVHAASLENIKHLVAIESSQDFLDHLIRTNPVLSDAVESNRATLVAIDIGRTRNWGKPVNTKNQANWPTYTRAPFELRRDYDVILIDGRFRVACGLQALLYAPTNVVVLFHDFWNRREYRILLDFFDVEARIDTLAVLRRKTDADLDRALKLLEEYLWEPCDREWSSRLSFAITRYLPERWFRK